MKLARLLSMSALVALAPVAALSQTVLNFPSWQTEDRVFAPWWQSVIAEFESQNPGVKVNMTAIPFAQYVQQLTVQFAASTPPDIVHLPTRNFGPFASEGWLESLDDRLAATDIPTAWSPLQAGMVWDGTTQGVLLMGYGSVMYYNEALLNAAGLAVPTTADELLAAIEAISKPDEGIFGFGGTTTEHPNVATELANWAINQGTNLVKDGKYNFTDPEVIAAIDKYRAAYKQASPGQGSTQVSQLFIDGKIGFVLGGPFSWPNYVLADGSRQPDIKMARLPFPHTSGATSNSLHLAVDTEDDKKELAWKFIQVATSPEFMASYTAQTYSPAGRMDALSAEAMEKDPVLKIVADAAAEAVDNFPPSLTVQANYNEYAKYLTSAGLRLQGTDEPTEKILAELQAELERRLPLN